MVRRRNGWQVALIAACMLVLNVAVSAFALGAMPNPPQLDVFGNPICSSAEHSDTGDHGGGHGQPTDCCLLGCSMSSQLLVTAPSDAGWVLPIPVSSDGLRSLSSKVRFRARENYSGYPRAPPTLIS